MARASQKKATTRKAATKSGRQMDVARRISRPSVEPKSDSSTNWATDLEFDIKEPKLAVSLRLDADVLRFFRDFGSGYQTRINEVLKAFMHARQRAGLMPGGGDVKVGRSRARARISA